MVRCRDAALVSSFTMMGLYMLSRRRKVTLLYMVSLVLMFSMMVYMKGPASTGGGALYQDSMVDYDDMNCGCPRSYPSSLRSSHNSLCSNEATARGDGQRVVAYAVYGVFHKQGPYTQYWGQIEDRVNDVANKYPGWVMRLYHNVSRTEVNKFKLLCHLYCLYPNLDLCHSPSLFPSYEASQVHEETQKKEDNLIPLENSDKMEKLPEEKRRERVDHNAIIPDPPPLPPKSNKDEEDDFEREEHPLNFMKVLLEKQKESAKSDAAVQKSYADLLIPKMWRYLPMADPTVSEFIVRDVDSSILPREVAAVGQWLNETTGIMHAMRDHPSHNGVILAGMWGASRARGSERLDDLFKKILKWPPRHLWDYDQKILQRTVWPDIKDSIIIHDSYFCENRRFVADHRSLPFPTRRRGTDFVSWGILRDHERKSIVPCPKACRPTEHQDWVNC